MDPITPTVTAAPGYLIVCQYKHFDQIRSANILSLNLKISFSVSGLYEAKSLISGVPQSAGPFHV